MSSIAAREFLNKIMSDAELAKKFAGINSDEESISGLIKEEGYDCTPEELLEAVNQIDN